MAKNDKKSATPRLRFPEFQGKEGWEPKKLEDVAPLQRGFDLPSDQIEPGHIPVVYSNGVQAFHSTGMAKGPGLVTGRSGTIGKLHFIESGDYWPHNTSLWVTSFKENIPKFIYFLYDSMGITRFASGSGVPTLNRNDVHAFETSVPPTISEQQKIADCLTSLDLTIAAQGQKLEALEAHKQGLMQQLFPREGETLPRLRFSEFRNGEEWEKVAFGTLDFEIGDGNYSSKYPRQSDFVKSGIPFLRANNLRDGSVLDEDMRFITKKQHSEITKGHLIKGDILLSTRGEIGLVALVPDRHVGSNINAQLVRINTKGKSDNIFVFHLLDDLRRKSVFDSLSTGTALKQLPIGKLNKLELVIPKLLEEQHRIASCLSSLDSIIAAESKKLDLLKTHKKGLMQQLFPVVEENS